MTLPFGERLRRFYRRNDVLFWCSGLVVFSHIVWWQVQQNRAFVPKRDRVRHIGPIPIPYLDETEFYKKHGLTTPEPSSPPLPSTSSRK